MTNHSRIITATHPQHGAMFAAVDPTATYITPQVTELRFAALLAPFRTSAEATAALAEAGCELDGETQA